MIMMVMSGVVSRRDQCLLACCLVQRAWGAPFILGREIP
jgi:hypothetical protein